MFYVGQIVLSNCSTVSYSLLKNTTVNPVQVFRYFSKVGSFKVHVILERVVHISIHIDLPRVGWL
jgi:hypothetical protein